MGVTSGYQILDWNFKNYILIFIIIIKYIYTSSTAQGGGGSFKDRKPIGEVA